MMLGPAVAAATAVALWVSVDRSGPVQVAQQKEEAPADATVPSGPPTATVPPSAPLPERVAQSGDAEQKLADALRAEGRRQRENENISRRAAETDKRTEFRANEGRDALAPAPAPPPGAARAPVAATETQTVVAGTPAVQAPPPAVQTGALQQVAQSQAQAQAPNQQAAQGRADGASSGQRTAADQVVIVPRAPTGGSGRGGGAVGGYTQTARARADSALLELASSDASVRWRILAGRVVQHSGDKGTTWATQFTPADDVSLTAGASPSPSVCWLVGRAGIILRTTDGKTWQRVPFPEPVDLAAVAASDARTATVSTVDGRTFATADGQSWILQKF
jgi:hypothetical protein